MRNKMCWKAQNKLSKNVFFGRTGWNQTKDFSVNTKSKFLVKQHWKRLYHAIQLNFLSLQFYNGFKLKHILKVDGDYKVVCEVCNKDYKVTLQASSPRKNTFKVYVQNFKKHVLEPWTSGRRKWVDRGRKWFHQQSID